MYFEFAVIQIWLIFHIFYALKIYDSSGKKKEFEIQFSDFATNLSIFPVNRCVCLFQFE